MKIVFYRHSLLNRGGDKMIVAHAAYLAEQGHEVTIQASVVDTVFSIPDGVKVVCSGQTSKLRTLLSALFLRTSADRVVVDIIPLACLLAISQRRRLIYFAQDYDESYYRSVISRLMIRAFYYFGLTVMRVKTVAVADHLTELLRRRFRANVVTSENGVDDSLFYPDPDPELVAGKGSEKSVVVLSRSDSRKGFDLACRIIEDVRRRRGREGWQVWTVGEPAADAFADVAHHDFGYVQAGQLRQILSSADVLLYHTRHEGFPLLALESMACGCPMVVSTAVSVVVHDREALISGVGDISTAADHVMQLLSDESLSQRLRDHGLDFARQHSLAASSSRFCELLAADPPSVWG